MTCLPHGLRPPATFVVGPVVALLERIQWAERRPLFGRRVLVPADYPNPMTEPLERLGAEVLHVAPVEIGPPASWEPLDGALRQLARFARCHVRRRRGRVGNDPAAGSGGR